MIAAWGLLALLAAPVEVQHAHDEPPTLALRWSAIAPCPTREQLVERIGAQGLTLGEWVPEVHDHARLSARIDVAPAGAVWRAELELVDADGRAQRSFEASSCDALAEAVALIVAVTLDPVAVTQALARRDAAIVEPEPSPEPEPAPEPEPTARPPLGPVASDDDEQGIQLVLDADDDELQRRARPRLRVGVSLHGGASYGPTLRAFGLLGGRAALLGEAWRVELGARWAAPRRVVDTGAAASIDAWMVELRGCGVPKPGPIELPICLGVEAGLVRGLGRDPVPDPARATFAWLAPSLSVGLRWAPVERFAFGPELALVVPVTRGRFVAGTRELDRLATIGARALLELELRLP